MTEYFDVVDEDDKPTGKLVTKVQAHREGLLHRIAAVYVFDAEGRLLVQDHKKSKLLDHSVGGHVSADEDYDTAVRRESDEELNLQGETLVPLYLGLYSDEVFDGDTKRDFQMHFQMHFFGIYECHPSARWKFVPNDEVERIIPMEVAEVVQQMNETPGKFTPGFINTMEKYLEVTKSPLLLDMAKARANWSKTR